MTIHEPGATIELAGWSDVESSHIRTVLSHAVAPGLQVVAQLLERALLRDARSFDVLEMRSLLELFFERQDDTLDKGRPLTDADCQRVYEIFRGLEHGLIQPGRRLEIINGGDEGPDYFGSTEEDSDEIIYLYKPWWGLESIIEQAGVLVHELTHVWHRTGDRGYSDPWCNPVRYTLPYKGPEAQLWTDDLLNNADTYQGLFEAACKKGMGKLKGVMEMLTDRATKGQKERTG